MLETETGEASRESHISRPESSHSKVNAGETNTPLQEQLTHTNKQQRTTPSQGHQARKNTTPSQNKAKKTINTSTTKPTTTTKVISKNHVVYYKHTLCMHAKRRDKCKQCGGVGLCQHFVCGTNAGIATVVEFAYTNGGAAGARNVSNHKYLCNNARPASQWQKYGNVRRNRTTACQSIWRR